jgi:hypothetical protein
MHAPVIRQMRARAASFRCSTLPIRRRRDRRREERQVGAAAQGGAPEAPGAAAGSGCCGSGRGQIAAAGNGEYRDCHFFSFSHLLIVERYKRDPQIN